MSRRATPSPVHENSPTGVDDLDSVAALPPSPSHQGEHQLPSKHSSFVVQPRRRRGMSSPHNSMAEKEDFFEKDVEGNYLCESHYYRGFSYMLKHTEVELCTSLRSDLFPTLALALESVLRKVVHEQLDREAKDEKTDSNSRSPLRQRPTYPSQPLQSGRNPVQLLAEELKRINAKKKAALSTRSSVSAETSQEDSVQC